METFYTVLALLLIICASNIMNHFIPAIPVPLFQVALGSALVLLSPQLEMVMNPELFFVLFVAPILFNDGKRVLAAEIKDGKYYDTGNKLEYLKTVVEFALEHPEIKEKFSSYLRTLDISQSLVESILVLSYPDGMII